MIRILNAEPDDYSPEARRVLQSIGELDEQSFTHEELLHTLPQFDVLIIRLKFHIDRQVLEAARPRLKVIVTATTGLNHIDVESAHQLGIEVLSLRGETEFLRSVSATAEHTWALLLALARHLPQAFESVQRGEWDRDRYKGMQLSGKRLGIVGLGRLGRLVARYGLSFNMKVLAYDPFQTEWVPDVIRCASLTALLEQADVLSLHVPLNDETKNLIGAAELQKLSSSSLVINTSRGEVVDESALIAALQSGHLAGAAVDVVTGEHEQAGLPTSPLLNYLQIHQNLIVTPHIGGATYESMAATELFMAKKLKRFVETSPAFHS